MAFEEKTVNRINKFNGSEEDFYQWRKDIESLMDVQGLWMYIADPSTQRDVSDAKVWLHNGHCRRQG